jgi:hypothetical protein
VDRVRWGFYSVLPSLCLITMESSHWSYKLFFTPKPNPIPKLYTFVYIFYSNTWTLLHIQAGLKTQEACLKTHKRESRKYKIQHVVQSPRIDMKTLNCGGNFFDNFGAFSWAGSWGSLPIRPPIDFWPWLGHGMAQMYRNQSVEANHK